MKCHLASESHLRNMKLFGQNSSKIIGQNSRAVRLIIIIVSSLKEGFLVFFELAIQIDVFLQILCSHKLYA